jgi:hypothetical protein
VEPKQRTLIMLTPAPLARSAELAKELAFAYQVPAVLLAEVVAAEDRRLRDEAWAAQEAAREARVADAMAAAEAAGTEYVPTEEDEYVEPEAPPAPLDPANISGCIAAALSREKRPDGAVIVMPEQPTVFATKEQLLEAVVLALGYAPPPPPDRAAGGRYTFGAARPAGGSAGSAGAAAAPARAQREPAVVARRRAEHFCLGRGCCWRGCCRRGSRLRRRRRRQRQP